MQSLIHPNRHEDMARKEIQYRTKTKKRDDDSAPLGSSSNVRRKRTNIAWNANSNELNNNNNNNNETKQVYFSVNNE